MDILDEYDATRRELYHTFTDHLSSTNLLRMIQDGDTVLDKDPILKMIAEASKIPNAAEMLQKVSSFSQSGSPATMSNFCISARGGSRGRYGATLQDHSTLSISLGRCGTVGT